MEPITCIKWLAKNINFCLFRTISQMVWVCSKIDFWYIVADELVSETGCIL